VNPLSLHQIKKSFAGSAVLNGIDLDVPAGSFVTLLGPSGCGKTTLLRIIAGLEQPDHGKILSDKRVLLDVANRVNMPAQQRQFGFVFQDYGLWPHMTVAANIAFPLQMARWSKSNIDKRVREVLQAVQLTGHAHKRPEQLSGGQKQRVSIARAIAAKPSVILFDEPLSNLDANLRDELGREIRQLTHQLGLTCINVTHDRREAQLLSDHIALLKDGMVHQQGQPESLFQAPKDMWTAQFLDAGNLLPAHLVCKNTPASKPWALVPRSAWRIDNQNSILTASVRSCLFIDDRFEIQADVAGHAIKFFSERAYAPEQILPLSVAPESLRFYSNMDSSVQPLAMEQRSTRIQSAELSVIA
jgi:ABC-type Fe3+/spermidine/putrescine transport system ATPase subunit